MASALVLGLSAAPALAQDAPEDAAADAPAEEVELTPEQKQAKAVELYKEANALAEARDFEGAIKKLEAAFELFPDLGLLFKIGEAYQIDGTEKRDYDKLRKAVKVYKVYIEKMTEQVLANPEQQEALQPNIDAAQKRVTELEESIEAEEIRIRRVADEEEQARLDAELEAKRKEEERLAKLAKQKEMQFVLSGGAVFGADQQLSGLLRMQGGGLLSWEKFALEAKVGIDGFLRVDQSQGVSARSITLLDVGARLGTEYGYVGPFVSGGASFGIFGGKPRERLLSDDMETCSGFDAGEPGSCSFNIDKNIATRLAFGYGFKASEKTTVAVRLEAQAWFFSVDGEQEIGSPPPALIEKPQTSFAFLAGLEFLRWM